MQSKTQKGTQNPREKKKDKGKKGSVGNDKKDNKNVEGEKNEKMKVKFTCNICGGDHLIHQFPQMEESQCLIKLQQPSILKNPFSQGQNMQVGSSTSNLQGGTSSAPFPDRYFFVH
jgi:hypothetical protein